MDLADDVLHLTGLPFLVGRERLAIDQVDRMERHGSAPDTRLLPLRRAGGRAVRYNPEHFSSEVENAICPKTLPWFPSPITPASGLERRHRRV